MNCDIIFSVAHQCGDKDCGVQWHQTDYWFYADGTYSVDWDGDGDHEDIDEKDLPSQEEIDKSWRDYAAYVAQTGLDPIGNFYVHHERKVKQRWDFWFSPCIGGIALKRARRAGVDYMWHELPQRIKEFLNIGRGPRLRDFDSANAARECGVNIGRRHSELIEVTVPNKQYDKQLRRAARKAMKQGLRADGLFRDECRGHPAGPDDPMGETVYCDGSCR